MDRQLIDENSFYDVLSRELVAVNRFSGRVPLINFFETFMQGEVLRDRFGRGTFELYLRPNTVLGR